MSQRLADLIVAWKDASALEVAVLITMAIAFAVVMGEWGWKALIEKRAEDWTAESNGRPTR